MTVIRQRVNEHLFTLDFQFTNGSKVDKAKCIPLYTNVLFLAAEIFKTFGISVVFLSYVIKFRK